MAQGDYHNPYDVPTDQIGVFHWLNLDEKARISGRTTIKPGYQDLKSAPGNWRIVIFGNDIPAGSQNVYMASRLDFA